MSYIAVPKYRPLAYASDIVTDVLYSGDEKHLQFVQEFVKLYQRHKMDERLLQFINKGTMIEKGVKGDIGEHPNDNHYHQEL